MMFSQITVTLCISKCTPFLERITVHCKCLYYDGVELCNPLGSNRTKHKIGKICDLFKLRSTFCRKFCTTNAYILCHSGPQSSHHPDHYVPGCFYYTEHPRLHSTIQILALVEYPLIKKYGLNAVPLTGHKRTRKCKFR